jgi:hypothetical protein
MIGQYLPNNNEKSYSAVLQIFLHLNQPLVNEQNMASKSYGIKHTLLVLLFANKKPTSHKAYHNP